MIQSDFKLKASELRNISEENIIRAKALPKNPIHIVLDRIVDTYNIGSAFRIADSINASKVWLCGQNIATPHDKQVRKSSLNTCQFAEWESLPETTQIFQQKGIFIALEEVSAIQEFSFKFENCKNINGICREMNIPIFIIIGSESFGISREVLEKVNTIVSIPMYGVNTSMNVINALTIICYSILGVI
jgi:tRNA G18 (ribose-2'-O)-methylase SpoU